ncbi:nuclear transport factor 2 family protein [Kangiella sp. TOML190]|uniref:nuclear transport factor 2 family protein n=1 Tax=Kangiella sp. TOML190 TaxID=2931351 RepID=UPI002040E9C8|nr:nuclear transport factor 2 family protein [Kangiella sp. TOML190]
MFNDRVDDFLSQLKMTEATQDSDAIQSKFEMVFKDFKKGVSESNIRSLYADTFYFNDTFKTITDIDQLVAYMTETAEQVETTKVEIIDVAKGKSDYYLRWVMHMKFKAKGRQVDSRSIGMTQIRLNAEGKIILHQDYWDGVEGFYQHLPYIGYFVRKVRDSL